MSVSTDKKPYTVLCQVPSGSRRGVAYEVRIGGDGRLYCTCPAWLHSRQGEKGCKHVRQIAPHYRYESDERFCLDESDVAV